MIEVPQEVPFKGRVIKVTHVGYFEGSQPSRMYPGEPDDVYEWEGEWEDTEEPLTLREYHLAFDHVVINLRCT